VRSGLDGFEDKFIVVESAEHHDARSRRSGGYFAGGCHAAGAGHLQIGLILLKAVAWLDLGERQAKGDPVDSKNVRKHANDVLRLSQLLTPAVRIEVAPRIAQDLQRFLDGIESDRTIDPKSFGINSSVAELVERIAQAYGLDRRRST
jgi:hypothetical protein